MTYQDILQQTQLSFQQDENQARAREDVACGGVSAPEKLDEVVLSMITGGGDKASFKGESSSSPSPKIKETHSEFDVVKDKPNLGECVKENYFMLRDTLDYKLISAKKAIGFAPAKGGWINVHLGK